MGAGISKFIFTNNNEIQKLEIDVNIVALALIFRIDKLMKQVKEEMATRQVSSIGGN